MSEELKTTEEVKTTEGNEGVGVETHVNEGVEVKTYTQEELQKSIDMAIAKKMAKMPTKEELAEYTKHKESMKTEAEKQTETIQKLTILEQEKNNVLRENTLLKKGVNLEDIDYVLFTVGKMEGDFETNLATFLLANTKYLTIKEKQTTGVAVNRSGNTHDDGVMAILKAKHPDL